MSRDAYKEVHKMKKELKKQLSAKRILMIITAVLAIISLFNNFTVFLLFGFAFNIARIQEKELKKRIKFLNFLDNLKL